ncbi:PREDICTED: uncharacterized protein LOC104785981 [Camelina sativa]|uniref:Uncharacterized protein LOC104785981 n=1 Tax=Camelina sativa TaxID=90675 RepID=A0ABM0Z2Q4_CAMSA|nr:PREDICTED: uncharacterized protein LOC104785981 [Camelina sativa]
MIRIVEEWSAARIQDIISDELNIEVWLAVMKTTLTEKGLWDVVANGIPPNPSKIPKLAATIQAEELRHWRELATEDMKALQILQSALPDSVFRETLLAASSAKDLWRLLNQVPDHVAEHFVGDFGLHDEIWLISSINSNHMTPYQRFFTDLDRTRKAKVKFTSGDGTTTTTTTYMAEGIGDVIFLTEEGVQTIENVLYVPGIKGNALSVSQLKKSGFGVAFDEEKRCTIWNQTTGKNFGKTMWENRGYCLRWNVLHQGSQVQCKKRKFT